MEPLNSSEAPPIAPVSIQRCEFINKTARLAVCVPTSQSWHSPANGSNQEAQQNLPGRYTVCGKGHRRPWTGRRLGNSLTKRPLLL